MGTEDNRDTRLNNRFTRFLAVAAVHVLAVFGISEADHGIVQKGKERKREASTSWQDMVDDAIHDAAKLPNQRSRKISILRAEEGKDGTITWHEVKIDFSQSSPLLTMRQGSSAQDEAMQVVFPENGIKVPKGFVVKAPQREIAQEEPAEIKQNHEESRRPAARKLRPVEGRHSAKHVNDPDTKGRAR